MSSWSHRRKSTYAAIVAIIIVGAVIIPLFLYVYESPTCFDSMMNGNEQGVDCGGSCERLCPSSFLAPDAAWTRFEEVAPGLYNVGAYIINPNTDGAAERVPYRVTLYDDRGVIITEYEGSVTLPPHRNTLAFRDAVNVGKRIPSKALFEFIAMPDWRKRSDELGSLVVTDKQYREDETGSSLAVRIANTSITPVEGIAVYVVLYDIDGNAVGFSRTTVDRVPAQGEAIAPFTWPRSRDGEVVSIEVLPVVE